MLEFCSLQISYAKLKCTYGEATFLMFEFEVVEEIKQILINFVLTEYKNICRIVNVKTKEM